MRDNSFERFYLEKMALGEGCGCAEHVSRLRDLDQAAAQAHIGFATARPVLPARLARLMARLIAPYLPARR